MSINSDYQLLVIGPLPPPLAGTSVSFKLFCDFISTESDKVDIKIINTAPKKLGTRPLLNLNNLLTALRVFWGCLLQTKKSDKVLLFGSNQFLLAMMPMCLLIAKIANKPFYVRSFGGSLDTYYLSLPPALRNYFRWVLNRVDGLLVQTRPLNDFFQNLLVSQVHLISGYRELPKTPINDKNELHNGTTLSIVYFGHIQKQKGVFDLLDSIKKLNNDHTKVTCDFFGPVYEEDAASFHKAISQTAGATFSGVLESHQVVSTIAHYDLFVFPTYYQGEGHPGVLIEAMIAGMPIITSNFKSIPDLVQHGVNGLLVSPKNPQEIADAIQQLLDDKGLMKKLAVESAQSAKQYCSSEVLPVFLNAIEVDY